MLLSTKTDLDSADKDVKKTLKLTTNQKKNQIKENRMEPKCI